MRVTRFIHSLAIVLVVAFGLKAAAQSEIARVGIKQLIATPDVFHGKRVQVAGFLRLEFEGNALYARQEDYARGLIENGIWVDTASLPWSAWFLDQRYVVIEAEYDAKRKGHLGAWSGSLTKIGWVERSNPPSGR
jgi:hypothetical protein